MADPIPYNRAADFSADQAVNPSSPLRGDRVDSEFDAVKVALDSLRAAVRDLRAADGTLRAQSVGVDQLDPSVYLGYDAPIVWLSGADYRIGNAVYFVDGATVALYICNEDHRGGVFAADLAAGRWLFLTNFSAASVAFTQEISRLEAERRVLLTTGSGDAYAAAPSPALGALAVGSTLRLRLDRSTSGAPMTLSVSALGAAPLRVRGDGGVLRDPRAGELLAGDPILVQYDGSAWVAEEGWPRRVLDLETGLASRAETLFLENERPLAGLSEVIIPVPAGVTVLEIDAVGLRSAVDGVQVRYQVSADGGATWEDASDSYFWGVLQTQNFASAPEAASATENSGYMGAAMLSALDVGFTSRMTGFNGMAGVRNFGQFYALAPGPIGFRGESIGFTAAAGGLNALRIFTDQSNFSTGWLRVIGHKGGA